MRIRQQFALGLFLAIVAGSPVNAATPIGTTVQASTTVSAGGRTLQKSSPIYFNDVVRSNATGVGQFVFDDGSKLAIGPSATVTIDKTIVKGKSAQRTGIQASKGAFRYISGAFSGHSLSTPYGTIGIRGTAFDFTIWNGRVYILLFKGSVSYGGKTLKRSCEFLVGRRGTASTPQALSAGVDKGLKVSEAFPLLVNQNRLSPQFRMGRNCLTRVVEINIRTQPVGARVRSENSVTVTGGGNKGFGNGDEGAHTMSDADNPGKGGGGPHN